MKLIEMMMRALTHLNIGATIAIVAWLLFSVVNAEKTGMEVPYVQIGSLSHTGSTPMQNVNVWATNQGTVSNRSIGWKVQP